MSDDRVRLIIDGDADGAVRAARQAKTAVDGLGTTTRNASKHASAFAAAQREQARTLTQLGHASKRAALGLTGLAAGGLAHAIKAGSDFEQQMARVDAVTGANAKQMQRLTKVALDLGAKTKYSAGQVSGAMYEMAAAGFKVGETTKALPGVLALAASSNIELKDAAEISSNALRGFKLEASESGHVADVMASAVNKSSLELVDLQYSMKYIGPIAATTGQSLEQMTAALSLMGNAGIKGEQAGTTLRGALVRLTKPTKMVHEALGMLGLKAEDLQGPKGLKPLSEIVKIIEQRTDGMGKATRNTALAQIFGTEALSGMVAVIDQGSGKLTTLTRAYKDSDGAALRSANTMNATVAGAFENLKGSIETVEISLFQRFRKPLRAALLDAAGMVNREGKEIEAFFERVTTLPEFKKADLGGQIEILLREIGNAVEDAELGEHLGKALSASLNAALPVVVKSIEAGAVEAAKAFANAFIGADPLGKVIIGGYLLKKTGGLAAIGTLLGGKMGKGGGVAGGLLSGGRGNSPANPLFVVAVNGGVGGAVPVPGKPGILGKIGGAARFAAAPLALGMAAGAAGRALEGGDDAPKYWRELAASMDRIPTAKLREYRIEAERIIAKGKVGEKDARSLKDLANAADRELKGRVLGAFAATQSSAGRNLSEIRSQVRASTRTIKTNFGPETKEAQEALAHNFRLAASAIRKSMKDGEISTETGLAEIDKMFRAALGQYGLKTLSTKPKDLPQLTKTPKGAKGAAHGFIGRPGAAGQDMIPLVVGEGEAVLNRHQQQVVDAALAAQGIGGLPELFQKVRTPHYMAEGGIAGGARIRRVKVRSDLGTVSKISQGAVDRTRKAAQDRLDEMAPTPSMGGPLPKGLSGGTSGANQALGRRMMLAAGFGPDQWPALKALWIGESGWSNTARNRSSGAFGIPQALPPSKMPLAAQRGDARAQIAWGLDYIKGRYGSPSAAYRFWQSQSPHWYARGGFVNAAKGKPGKGSKMTAKIVSRKAHLPSRRGRRLAYSLPLGSLRQVDQFGAQIDDAEQNRFPLMVRRHDLTDEQPLMTITDKTGEPVEVRDEGAIGTHVGELGEQRGLKIEISHLIAKQQVAARDALAVLHAGIRERREALKALRDKIKRNLSHIEAWKDAINRRRQKIRELRRQLQDISAERAPGKETRKQRSARLADKAKRQDGLRDQIRGIEDEITGLGGKIQGAENLNQALGVEVGDKDRQLGTWTTHRDDTQQLAGRLPNDMSNVMLDIAEIDKRITEWSGTAPPAVQAPSAGAAAGTGTDSQLAGLMAQQLDETRKSLALSRAQLGVFKDFAPLAAMRFQGAFLHGGRIRETGIARVHRDEYVVPDPEGPMANQLTASRGTGAAPVIVHLHVDGNIGPLMGRVRAEVDGRAAQVVSQQLGRRSRLITSAPGGR